MKEYFGGCHCGDIKFKFYANKTIEIWKCNCSICRMLDYEHLFIKHDHFKIIEGNELLADYAFGSKKAKHFFCKRCGIKSFYQPRSHPDSFSVNLKCVVEPPQIKNTVYFDGKNEFS